MRHALPGMFMVLGLGVVTTAATAQNTPRCSSSSNSWRNVCEAGVDGARLLLPVAGVLVSGGNPLPGTMRSFGGFPRFAIAFRVNTGTLALPDVDYAEYRGVDRTIAADREVTVAVPALEGALGLFHGGPQGIFGVDILGSLDAFPAEIADGGVRADVDARRIGSMTWSAGYGARATLAGGRYRPAITVSWMQRSLPHVDVGTLAESGGADGDRVTFGTDARIRMLRITASRQFGPLVVSAGYGTNRSEGDATVTFRSPITDMVEGPVAVSIAETRSLYFGNVALHLGPVQLTGEGGYLRGADQALWNTFEGNDPREKRFFGGIGLRIGG